MISKLNYTGISMKTGVNKRGDVAINILVIMTLLLVAIALSSFYTNKNEIKAAVGDVTYMEKIYSSEKSWEIYLRDKISNELIKKYSTLEVGKKSILELNEELISYISSVKILDKNDLTKEREVQINYKNGVLNAGLDEVLITGTLLITDKKRDWFWGVVPLSSYDELKARMGSIYRPVINVAIDLRREGLHSMEEIDESISNCKKIADLKAAEKCISDKLFNFVVILSKTSEGITEIKLSSKRSFLIDGQLKKIEFIIKGT